MNCKYLDKDFQEFFGGDLCFFKCSLNYDEIGEIELDTCFSDGKNKCKCILYEASKED